MKINRIEINKARCAFVTFFAVFLIGLSGCIGDDALKPDLDVLSDESKIIMNLHLDVSKEQVEDIDTRAAELDNNHVEDIFVFLFDKSGRYIGVEESIERKPGTALGATRFFVAFDKMAIQDIEKFKIVVVANLDKTLSEVKSSMTKISSFDKFLKDYKYLQFDAQTYGNDGNQLLTAVFNADKHQLTDLTAELVRPIARFKVSLMSNQDYVLSGVSLYGYSEHAHALYRLGTSNEVQSNPINPPTSLVKPLRLTNTKQITTKSPNSYITDDFMMAAEQSRDLLVVLECKSSSGSTKYFSSRISNTEIQRNTSYTINFVKLSGEGYATEAEAAVGEELSTSLVVTWDGRIREGYVRQHKYFGVGKSKVKEIIDMADEFSTYIQTNMAFEYSSEFNDPAFKPPVEAIGEEGKLQFYYVSEGGKLQLIPILDIKYGFFQTEVKQTVYLQHVAFNSDDPASSKEKFFVYKIGLAWTGEKLGKPDNFKVIMMYEGAELLVFDVTSASK